jgi:DNA-binding HxlR family transcriptional regulator
MPKKRNYHDACGIPRALDVVGERWALMVVRELLLGPKRFTDLRADLPRVSPDVLTQRLRELEANGVLRKRRLPPPAASQVYELTASGLALEPVLVALGRWGGGNAPPPAEGMGMSLDAHILSLRTLFDSERAAGLSGTLELRMADHSFRAELRDGDFLIDRGVAPGADAVIATDPPTLIALIHGERSLDEVVAAGDGEVEGDRGLAERFIGLFPLPEPAV